MYKKYKIESLLIIFYFLVILSYNSQLNIWYGGSSFGARHFVILIPFLMLPLSYSFKHFKVKYLLAFVIISIFLNVLGVQFIRDTTYIYQDTFESRFHSLKPIANPIFEVYVPAFFKYGPDSSLFFNTLGIKHIPFLNVILLVIVTVMLWRKEILRKIF